MRRIALVLTLGTVVLFCPACPQAGTSGLNMPSEANPAAEDDNRPAPPETAGPPADFAAEQDRPGASGNRAATPSFLTKEEVDALPVPAPWFAADGPGEAAAPGTTGNMPVLMPLNGFLMPSGEIRLSWSPVPDAVLSRVQLAVEPAFENPFFDQMVDVPALTMTLAEGTYYWRVQPFFTDGATADFTPANELILDDSVVLEDTGADNAEDQNAAKIRQRGKGTMPLVRLGVPRISQRKDTHLLLLESDRTAAGHGWDEPHRTYDNTDPADNMNCTPASVVMVNHFYGGHSSQDRLGYEVRRNEQAGPEGDLNWGRGVWPDDPLRFALGLAVPPTVPATYGQFWNEVIDELDQGRPVILVESVAGGSHTTVIIGYDVRAGHYYFVVNNPNNPGSERAACGLREYWKVPVLRYYLLGNGLAAGGHIAARSDEPNIKTDADGDGVYDFDETQRFGTDPKNADTDGDCIPDKDEIRSSMFHTTHGWATHKNKKGSDGHARSRPLATNPAGVPTAGRPELDRDADGGKLPDFVEDANFNGQYEPDLGETDPYDDTDDYRKAAGSYETAQDTIEDTSARNHYAYNSIGVTDHFRVDYEMETDKDGKLKGKAKIKHTRRGYFTFRDPTHCHTLIYRVESFDRTWETGLEGRFECLPGAKGPQLAIAAAAALDGRDVVGYDVYNDDCDVVDLLIGPYPGRAWTGFYLYDIVKNQFDEKREIPLPPNQTGTWQTEQHLKITTKK